MRMADRRSHPYSSGVEMKNGKVSISKYSLVLDAGISEDDFLAKLAGVDLKPYRNGPHSTYSIRDVDVCFKPAALTVYFRDGKITMLSIVPLDRDWPWPESQSELDTMTEACAKWIEECVGSRPPLSYPGCQVTASGDMKSGFSSVKISYS